MRYDTETVCAHQEHCSFVERPGVLAGCSRRNLITYRVILPDQYVGSALDSSHSPVTPAVGHTSYFPTNTFSHSRPQLCPTIGAVGWEWNRSNSHRRSSSCDDNFSHS